MTAGLADWLAWLAWLAGWLISSLAGLAGRFWACGRGLIDCLDCDTFHGCEGRC